MKSKAEVMKKLDMVAKEIEDTEAQRMNAMLAPQPYDCDVESQIVKIRYEAQEWEKNHRGEIHGGADVGDVRNLHGEGACWRFPKTISYPRQT